MPFRALIDACWKEKYTSARFTRDLIAGITVGIIAIPLAMALAIGSGVPPQYGLYTSAVAGIVIALTGGSRFSVSGPTAAFVVILYPVSQQFGLAGLRLHERSGQHRRFQAGRPQPRRRPRTARPQTARRTVAACCSMNPPRRWILLIKSMFWRWCIVSASSAA